MLKQLQVKNFAIIDDAELSFSRGLNVLTGETGAGKTLIIEAINLLIGERADNTLIRDGEDRLLVQGYFDFNDNSQIRNFLLNQKLADVNDDLEDLVICREVNRKGRNRAYINGIYVQVSTLKQLGSLFIDIHGQHDHQYLLDSGSHIKIIDKFQKKDIDQLKQDYLGSLEKYNNIKNELDKLTQQQSEKEKKLEDLRFKAEEIESLNIKDNEEQELENDKRILKNYEKIFQLTSECIGILKSDNHDQLSLIDLLGKIKDNISKLSEIDKGFSDYMEEISATSAVLDDLSHHLNSYIADFDYSPQKLDYIQERLYKFDELKKKYGMSLNSIKKFASELRQKIDNLDNIENHLNKIESELKKLKEETVRKAMSLSKLRKQTSMQIEHSLSEELKELGFNKAVFSISHNYLYNNQAGNRTFLFTEEGIDDIEFMVSLNIGQEPRPLKKIASGGEVSRIMLALKSIIGSMDFVSTMIFDEIDSGIGGATSLIVGQKLSNISKEYQTICITHLAQIAAFADSHYFIEKYIEHDTTKIKVRELKNKNRIGELARMLGGLIDSKISIKHAEELLAKCKQLKGNLKGSEEQIGY